MNKDEISDRFLNPFSYIRLIKVNKKEVRINMEKRGLSEIVTTILIVLLAITALVVIWQLILPMITKNVETTVDIQDCAKMQLSIEDVSYSKTDATVTLKRDADQGTDKKLEIKELKSVWYAADGTAKEALLTITGPAEFASATSGKAGDLGFDPVSVKVYLVLKGVDKGVECPGALTHVKTA